MYLERRVARCVPIAQISAILSIPSSVCATEDLHCFIFNTPLVLTNCEAVQSRPALGCLKVLQAQTRWSF